MNLITRSFCYTSLRKANSDQLKFIAYTQFSRVCLMVKIISGTTACLPRSFQIEYEIPVIPQMIPFREIS